MVDWIGIMGMANFGKWLGRFLAEVMLFAVAWPMRILCQLNPSAPINADRRGFSEALAVPENR